jgi:hypothetical protein
MKGADRYVVWWEIVSMLTIGVPETGWSGDEKKIAAADVKKM